VIVPPQEHNPIHARARVQICQSRKVSILKLIGLNSSPFCRRLAITLRIARVPFDRRKLSVYDDFEELRQINPLGTGPVLQLDDGRTLIDSAAIIAHLSTQHMRIAEMGHPDDHGRQFFMLRLVAFCNATCEKVGQLYRETIGRPTELRCPEIVARMQDQIGGGIAEIERMVSSQDNLRTVPDHASIAASITMSFLNHYKAVIPLGSFSCRSLVELADFWEQSKEFREEQIE
jgi:glutathione S-transferase